ncbi:MAG: response regulator [Butyrivibrio sp.]|nr:response regulator [Butyrivibrio sp.]
MLSGISYEIAALVFDIVLTFYVCMVYSNESKTARTFKLFSVIFTVAVFIDVVTLIVMTSAYRFPASVHYIIHSLNILSSTLAASSYADYVVSCGNYISNRHVLGRINLTLIIVQCALMFLNVFTGSVFSYSIKNGYNHGMLFLACSVIIPCYYIVLASGFVAANYRNYTITQLLSICLASIVVFVILFVQMLVVKDLSLLYFAASVALLILFFTLETPDYNKLEKTIVKLEKAEKEANEAVVEARKANDEKNEFLSQMSHEIRTPINSILGFNNLILENTREAKTSEYAGRIKGAGENLLAFFNNLLNVIAQNPGEDVDIKSFSDYSALLDNDENEVLVPIMPKAMILVVDDNQMNIDLLIKILKRCESIIDTAEDGQKALMKLRKNEYDLVIMDHMMPIMDGVETLSIMREERLSKDAPVIMLTAGGLRGDEQRFKELGFDAYLTKPIVANVLYELLGDLMDPALIEQRVSLEHLFYTENMSEKTPGEVEVKKKRKSFTEIFGFINSKAGLEFCMGDEEFYVSQLKAFVDSNKGDELEGFLKNKDFDSYLISVHSLKSTAKTIGADDVSEEALKLELALKEGHPEEVTDGHPSLKKHYDELCEKLLSGIKEYNNEFEDTVEEQVTSPEDDTLAAFSDKLGGGGALSAQILLALANTVDSRDINNPGRSLRVAKIATEIARRLGKSDDEQQDIYYMGLVHDIGKLIIPEKILRKPDRLTPEESEIVRQHPVIGYEILRNVSEMPGLATGARWHHERFDGTGYPDGLAGDEIPLEARIIGIADAYEAMTSERAYASVMPPVRIIKELEKNRGVQFDPALVDVLVEMIGEGR